MFYPFHKDGWKVIIQNISGGLIFDFQVISGHVLISSLACVGPVYAMVHMLLSQPGESIYFWIRG